jgi:hypothetical protein
MKKFGIILVLLAVLAATFSPALAGGYYTSCGSYYLPQYQYIYKEVPVAYPVPFTVAVPVVSYLYNGGGTYAPVFSAQYANSAPPFQTQQPQTTEAAPFTDEQINYLFNKFEERMRQKYGDGSNGNGQPKTTLPPVAPPEAEIPYSDSAVLAIFKKQRGSTMKACTDCHGASNFKGGLSLIDAGGNLKPNLDRFRIFDAADEGRMPKEVLEKNNPNAAVTNAEMAVLREWVRRGNQTKK